MAGMSPKGSTDRLTPVRVDRFLCNLWVDQEVLGNLVQKMKESYDIVGQSVSRVDGLKS